MLAAQGRCLQEQYVNRALPSTAAEPYAAVGAGLPLCTAAEQRVPHTVSCHALQQLALAVPHVLYVLLQVQSQVAAAAWGQSTPGEPAYAAPAPLP
jgi:hypothetical protein